MLGRWFINLSRRTDGHMCSLMAACCCRRGLFRRPRGRELLVITNGAALVAYLGYVGFLWHRLSGAGPGEIVTHRRDRSRFGCVEDFSPSGEPSFSLSALTSVPTSAFMPAVNLSVVMSKQKTYKSRSLNPASPLLNLAIAAASSIFSSATALSSIAFASAAVPKSAFCAKAAVDSMSAPVAPATIRVCETWFPPRGLCVSTCVPGELNRAENCECALRRLCRHRLERRPVRVR